MKVKSIKPFVTSKNRAIGYGKGEVINIEDCEYEEIKDSVEVVARTKKRGDKSAKRDVEKHAEPAPGPDCVYTRSGGFDENPELGAAEE
jgi:hypothetical protein